MGSTQRMVGAILPASFSRREREGEAGEVGAAAGASDQQVGGLANSIELLQGLFAYDGLVHQDMVEHAAERVLGVRIAGRGFDRFGDGDAEAAGGVGILGQDGATGIGEFRRAGMHRGPEDLHQRAAVGLLLIGGGDLPNLTAESELGTGEGEGAAPLPGPGLGGQTLGPFLGVVIGLGHGGVGFVGSGRADAFVLEIDTSGSVERLLEPAGAVEGGGPPHLVDVEDRSGNVDVRSCDTSCMMSAIGNRGARSSGPMGWWVPGWSTGGAGSGRSGWMLYQALGISDSSRITFVTSAAISHLLSGGGT